MKRIGVFFLACMLLSGCMYAAPAANRPQATPSNVAASNNLPVSSPTLAATETSTPAPANPVNEDIIPNFDHIVLIVLENEYSQNVIGSLSRPAFNALAGQNALLTDYSAITHPSLPNYLALISGSTQNITSDCSDCFVDGPNLADEIEASGRTWKAYLEALPSPCFVGNRKPYMQFMNPFIYFDSIRLDLPRCERSIVPLTQLDKDLAAGTLPNFVYIAPDLCDSGHDCSANISDAWLGSIVAKLQASPALGQNSLIVVTFDEGRQSNPPVITHGQVATLIISPLAHKGLADSKPYSHYSLLKTILLSWNLPQLGQAQLATTNPIVDPWMDQTSSVSPPVSSTGP